MDLNRLTQATVDQLVLRVAPNDANDVLWHFTGTASRANANGAREPGSFRQLLVRAASAADPWNQHALAEGFPGVVAAVQLAQGCDDGLRILQRIAGG